MNEFALMVDSASMVPMRSDSAALLQVEGVGFAYSRRGNVLNDVSFSVAEGELVTLLGPNGAGKSTLLNCIMGLLEPQEGAIRIAGCDQSAYTHRELAQMIAYVPQSVDVTFAYTVRDYAVKIGRAHV